MKTLRRIIKITIWTVIAVYVSAVIIVHVPAVQAWIGRQAAGTISEKLGTKVTVGKVYLGFLNRIIIDDLVIYDQKTKPMLSSTRVAAKIDYGELVRNGRIYISSAQLFGMNGMFYKESADKAANFQFALDSLAAKDKSKKTSVNLSINSLIIRHGSIKFDKLYSPPTPSRFNTDHLAVSDISAHLVVPYYTADSLAVAVKNLSLKEHSGIDLRKLKLSLAVNKRRAILNDAEIQMPGTTIRLKQIEATYDTGKDGKPDMETLVFNGTLDNSELTLADLAWIEPRLGKASTPININAEFHGTAHSINITRLNLNSRDGIRLVASGGASKTQKGTAWHADIRRLECNVTEAYKTFGGMADTNNEPPIILGHLGNISYTGTASGNNDIVRLNGTISSGVGGAVVKLTKSGKHISANVNTDGINISKLTDDKKFGIIAANATVHCDTDGKKISNIQVNGDFPRIDFNGYSYKGISAKGVYNNYALDGTLSVDDPNGQISIDGHIDLGKKMQSTDIHATIRNLDLAALKITDKWQGAKFDIDISANTRIADTEANLFSGRVSLRNFIMTGGDKTYKLDSMTVVADNGGLVMQSDFCQAELKGEYKLKTLAQSFMNMLHAKLPSVIQKQKPADNSFRLTAQITKSDWINSLLGIPFVLNSPLEIEANVNDRLELAEITCHTNKLTYNESPYENLSISAGSTSDTLTVNGKVVKTMDNGHKLGLGIIAIASNDKISTAMSWDNYQEKHMAGTLNAETSFVKEKGRLTGVDIDVKPSDILVNDTTWNVLPSTIIYSDGDLTINHFAIEHNRQHIRIDGMATKHTTDSITIDMQDVDVSYVLGLVNFHSVEFSGDLTGKAYVKSVFYEPDAYANLTIDNFRFEQGRMGKLYAYVNWDKTDKQINIDAHADDANNAHTIIKGYVSPAHNYIDLGIKAEDTNIEFLESFCGSFMSDISGKANGAVRVHGPLDAIELTGRLVTDGNALITPTNVAYKLQNDTIRFLPGNIVFNADTIRDRNGNIGIVNGALHHKHLSHLTYNINISTQNLLCYDTKSYGSDTFYGTAYGTGTCNISGGNGRIDIDIDITPEQGSFIEYNAASPEAISDQQFITWNDKTTLQTIASDTTASDNSTTSEPIETPPTDIPSDMRINFLINMTPNATLRVLMDKNTNDYIALNGNGTIRASYFNKGSFDMFGTYAIDHGVYTLTIQNIIKKVFQFQRGGTIVFGGDPYDALLNLQAVYTVNSVPLSDLQLGNSFSSNNVRVDCLMNISGTPQTPHVDFNIDMPTVSEDAEQMVRTVINSEEEMNQQVVYLLSVGRFYMQSNNNAADQGQPNQTSLAMQSLLSGTISQQINTLLGSLVKNNNWTFGANISTGDEGFNNAEYEGLLSGRLLNNRLIINGQFGYRDNANATTSFIGDFDINYLLLPNGNISLKVYNQTNDRYFTKSSLNTQGIGLILKKDFNTFLDLFGIKKKRKIKPTKQKK